MGRRTDHLRTARLFQRFRSHSQCQIACSRTFSELRSDPVPALLVTDSLPSLERAENQVTLFGVPSQILAVAISDSLAAAAYISLVKQLELNRFGCAVG